EGGDEAVGERIGRDAFLVVDNGEIGVDDQGDRLAPGVASVRRAAGQDGLVCVVDEVEAQPDLVRYAIRRNRDPRVRGALVVAIVGGGAARAAAEVREGAPPGLAAVGRDAGQQTARAAEPPAILLPNANHVCLLARGGRDHRLDFGVPPIHRTRRRAGGADREWSPPGGAAARGGAGGGGGP